MKEGLPVLLRFYNILHMCVDALLPSLYTGADEETEVHRKVINCLLSPRQLMAELGLHVKTQCS